MDEGTTEADDISAGGPRGLAAFERRCAVLLETLDALSNAARLQSYQAAARENVTRWRSERKALIAKTDKDPARVRVGRVLSGDWGVVARALTEEYGETFAVLNMANAYHPGGGYRDGAPAQEENMFRRTDCHFTVGPPDVDPATEMYTPDFSALLNAEAGRVYLDVEAPRVCVRGPEDGKRADLGYAWLEAEDVFPFLELRAAAQDLSWGGEFDEQDARRRIAAQLDTLVEYETRHAVLGAHGCGVFGNPVEVIAQLYGEELEKRARAFECVAFAIHHGGHGRDNYSPFAAAFA